MKAFSRDFRDLIERMLAFNPEDRLTIDQIKEHPWYKGSVPTQAEITQDFKKRKQEIYDQHKKQNEETKIDKQIMEQG